MHPEILSDQQVKLLPILESFKREFYLVGGTAIALRIGHRRSIDFDLFKYNQLHHKKIIDKLSTFNQKFSITRRTLEQLNLNIEDVKFTFFQYPYPIEPKVSFNSLIKMPSLIDLASMKAYALGKRSKWKDYVDLFFLIRDSFPVSEIIDNSVKIYGDLFSPKLFRAQLSYFGDIDFSEPVEFIVSPIGQTDIMQFLTETALNIQL